MDPDGPKAPGWLRVRRFEILINANLQICLEIVILTGKIRAFQQ